MRTLLLAIVAMGIVACKNTELERQANEVTDRAAMMGKQLKDKGAEWQKRYEAASTTANDLAALVQKQRKLTAQTQEFISKTLKDADPMIASSVIPVVEEVAKNAPKALPFLEKEIGAKIKASSGDAKNAWEILLKRVRDLAKTSQ